MKNLIYISILSVFFISGCGDAENGDSGLNTAIAITSYNGSECANGGIEISYGLDDDSNGELSSLEVDGSSVVCNGADGQDGQDGTDGQDGQDGQDGSNAEVVVLMQSLAGSEFGFVNNGDGSGYLGLTLTNEAITSDVVNNGTITIEKLYDGNYMQMPLNVYFGETSTSYGDMIEGLYQYRVGSIDIIWSSTYDYTPTQWNNLSDLWAGTYKIRIVSPS